MKKSLEDELMSLAHRVLQLRGADDVHELKAVAEALYEKLAILSFVEKHFEGPKPTIGRFDVEQALENDQPESTADTEELEEVSSSTTNVSHEVEAEQPEAVEEQPETSNAAEQPETPEPVVEETATEEENEVEEALESVEETAAPEEENSLYEDQESKPLAEVEETEDEENSVNDVEPLQEQEADTTKETIETEDEIETETDSTEGETPATAAVDDSEPENKQEEEKSEPAVELTDDMRNIAVHYDDLPDFEPIDFSAEETAPKDASESAPEPVADAIDFEPIKPEEQPESAPDLFSTAKKVRTRNDLNPGRKSLNERLNHGLKFGLNDRLAFVNHLFNGDSADFDRVISQLNTISTYSEAEVFIKEQIKPDYNWENEELYEERFFLAVEKRMTN